MKKFLSFKVLSVGMVAIAAAITAVWSSPALAFNPLDPLGLFNGSSGTFDGGGSSLEPEIFDEGNISSLMERIARSFSGAPGLIAAVAYLTGLVVAVTAILKMRQAIDDPQTSPREAIVRIFIAGTLFAMPTITQLAMMTIGPTADGGEVKNIFSWSSIGDTLTTSLGANACDANRALNAVDGAISGLGSGSIVGGILGGAGSYFGGGTLGQMMCYASHAFAALPGLLGTFLYIAGLFLVLWSLLQLRDHLLKPDNVPISGPIKKMLVAGMFFAFPYVTDIVANTTDQGNGLIAPEALATATCASGTTGTLLNIAGGIMGLISGDGSGSNASQSGGLDCMMVRLISDIWGPMQMAIAIFCYLAGIILIAVAIRRMLDNMDKGAKSPVGIGTIAMVLIGGILLSFDAFLRTLTVSMFPDFFSTVGVAKLNLAAELQYAPGIDTDSLDSINTVISSVLTFSVLIGVISVIRGLFIMKEVANGGNASMMASLTHILAGGMAINLGPLIMMVQNTMGLSEVGLDVSAF